MRWLAILGISLVSLSGCSIADALENAPCDSDDDCAGSYTCVRTQHQMLAVPMLPGLCREDGQCASGTQEGCIAPDAVASCSSLTKVCVESTTTCYCCDTGGSTDVSLTNFSADGTSAQCVTCPVDLCAEGAASETCYQGDPRCTLAEGQSCGCRVPADEIENSECEDDSTCGDGFVCTRTLEQEEEPAEAGINGQDIAEEPGWCRPEEAPE